MASQYTAINCPFCLTIASRLNKNGHVPQKIQGRGTIEPMDGSWLMKCVECLNQFWWSEITDQAQKYLERRKKKALKTLPVECDD